MSPSLQLLPETPHHHAKVTKIIFPKGYLDRSTRQRQLLENNISVTFAWWLRIHAIKEISTSIPSIAINCNSSHQHDSVSSVGYASSFSLNAPSLRPTAPLTTRKNGYLKQMNIAEVSFRSSTWSGVAKKDAGSCSLRHRP